MYWESQWKAEYTVQYFVSGHQLSQWGQNFYYILVDT